MLPKNAEIENPRLFLYAGFFFLILLNIILRYPISPHEMGIDSFFIHALGQSIADNGVIRWALSPLSLAGLYPYSYSTGVPVFIAVSSLVTGLGMETNIFILSILFGVFGIFSAYLLAGEFSHEVRFRFLAALIFSLAPVTLKYTTWTMSARGLFLVLLPLLIWALLRFFRSPSVKNIIIIGVLAVTLFSIHKMVVFVVPLAVCMVISLAILMLQRKHPVITDSKKAYLIPLYFGMLICLFLISFFFLQDSWAIRYVSFDGSQWYHYLFGTIFTVIARYGFILLLSAAGLIFLFKTKFEEKLPSLFLLTVFLFIIPFFGHSMYVHEMMLPFFSIAAAYGFCFCVSLSQQYNLLKKTSGVVVIVLILSMVVFSAFTQIVKYSNKDSSGYGNYMYDETYYLANFVQQDTANAPLNGGYEVNTGLAQLSAFTSNPNPNMMGIQYLLDRNYDPDISIRFNPLPHNINQLSGFIRSPFAADLNINQIPVQYTLSLNGRQDESLNMPNSSKIYTNGFENFWYSNRE